MPLETTLEINWKKEFKKLFPETTLRTVPYNHVICEQCGGLGLRRTDDYITGCQKCFGKGHYAVSCPKCGGELPRGYIICRACSSAKRQAEEAERDLKNFETAEKISFKDYDGYFISLSNEERISDKGDFLDEYYDLEVENRPAWVYATRPVRCFGKIDLWDIIRDRTEDGYEEMFENLTARQDLIHQAQALIDTWETAQGNLLYSYHPDYQRIVLLDMEDIE